MTDPEFDLRSIEWYNLLSELSALTNQLPALVRGAGGEC